MAVDQFPEDLRDFVLKFIESIAQLEAVLLRYRNPGERWTAATCARRLYISEPEAAAVLDHLCDVGLSTCSNGVFDMAGVAAEQRSMVGRLAEYYARHLIQVTNLIHGKPRRLREFSDAFRFKKDRS